MRRRDRFSQTGFSVFDFWHRPSWRLGVDEGTRNRTWYVIFSVSLLIGFWFVWEGIIGGASLIRIVTISIVVSGVVFYFLIRLKQTALWGAGIAAVLAVMITGFEYNQWLDTGAWPAWTIGHMTEFVGFHKKPISNFAIMIWEFSLIGDFAGIALVFLLTWITAVRLWKFEVESSSPASGNGDVNNKSQEYRE